MSYQGFIKNTKEILNYENLPLKRKVRFWVHLPLIYLNRLLIKHNYKKAV